MNPLISIITPTYNCARFISETIKSVQAQSHKDWELIIVDDCSSDNTREIVGKFVKEDKRIKYHCLDKNSGAAIARNTALEMAKGSWIVFLDSDDLWDPDKLEKQLKFMIDNNYNFSYHEYAEIDENGNPLNILVSGPEKIGKIKMFSFCWPGCLTVMYNQDVVGKIQIEDLKKNNDYAMWLQVIKKADCYLLPENLANYRIRTGSISNTSIFKLIKYHYLLFKEAEHLNSIISFLFTINNLIWGVYKKLFYVKHIK